MFSLEWEYIGEGYSGDYEGTQEDERLMRFYLLEDGEAVSDCSYCTMVRVDHIDYSVLYEVAPILCDLIVNAPSMKKKAQELSWLDDDDIRKMVGGAQ